MTSTNKTIIAFDLYGTLLSTESIAKELATHFGNPKAQAIAALWRRYQLEYTWRLNSMSVYKPFNEITLASLNHALSESNETLSDTAINSLMSAYDSLDTFPDVIPALQSLASSSENIEVYVFTNGTESMVSKSVHSSPTLSPYAAIFKDLITVAEVKAFKPDPLVYQHLAKRAGKGISKDDMADMWLVSGNPFDVVGARQAGCQAAWIDRAGGHHGNGGWNDRLGELVGGGHGGPTVIVRGVDEAVKEIRTWIAEKGKGEVGWKASDAAMGPG